MEKHNSREHHPENHNSISKNDLDKIRQGSSIDEQAQKIREAREKTKLSLHSKLSSLDAQTRKIFLDSGKYSKILHQINSARSEKELKAINDEITTLDQKLQEETLRETAEEQEIAPEDPKLLALEKEFHKICENNTHLIGEKQLNAYKEWITQERIKNPSVRHLKDLVRRLQGLESQDKGGLFPRREEFNKLESLFKKHKLNTSLDNDWIRLEGLSERQIFRKNAEKLQSHFERMSGTIFYEPAVINKTMREVLMAKNPSAQEAIIVQAEEIARLEGEKGIVFDEKTTIAGLNVKKISPKSKQLYFEDYCKESLQDRKWQISNWEKIVNNEFQLLQKLSRLYKNRPEELGLALEPFSELDYLAKVRKLTEYEVMIAKNQKEKEFQQNFLINLAHQAIDNAEDEGIFSEKTADRFRRAFETEKNYQNHDGEIDLSLLKAHYETLVSSNPQMEFQGLGGKNISAYRKLHSEFKQKIKTYSELNDNEQISVTISELEEDFFNAGWQGKERILQKLKELISSRKKEKKSATDLKKTAETKAKNEKNKNTEAKEWTGNKQKTVQQALEYLSEDNPRAALKTLLLFDEENPDDLQILTMIEMVIAKIKEYAKNKNSQTEEVTAEEEMNQEIQAVATKEFKNEIIENKATEIQIEGAKQNQIRLQKTHILDRSLDTARDKYEEGSLEMELAEAFIQESRTSQTYEILDFNEKDELEKSGTHIVKFDNIDYTREELKNLHLKSKNEKADVANKKGILNISLKDASGREISAANANQLLVEETDELASKIVDHALENNGANKNNKNLIDFETRAAAIKKAREHIKGQDIKKLAA